jgi:hypothetical protein
VAGSPSFFAVILLEKNNDQLESASVKVKVPRLPPPSALADVHPGECVCSSLYPMNMDDETRDPEFCADHHHRETPVRVGS